MCANHYKVKQRTICEAEKKTKKSYTIKLQCYNVASFFNCLIKKWIWLSSFYRGKKETTNTIKYMKRISSLSLFIIWMHKIFLI